MGPAWSLELPRNGCSIAAARWLEVQLSRCDDDQFAAKFAAACEVPGLEIGRYRHRILELAEGHVLAGIRFKGCDVSLPFVELLAWQGTPQANWPQRLRDEFSEFRPRWLRYRWTRETEPPWTGEVDQYLYAGPARGRRHPEVEPCSDLLWFDEFQELFAHWRGSSPIGAEVWPASRSDFEDCLVRGHVVTIRRAGRFVGVAACRPGCERALEGWEMIEQFVAPDSQGCGLGVALQQELMQELPAGDLVWGTIHGANAASQATATRCGRAPVETWYFVAL